MSSYKIYATFLFLSIVWGASFMFMRIGVPEFGAPVFGGLRVVIAGLVLLPIFLKPKHLQEYRTNWLRLSLIGLLSTGTPFMLLSFAAYQINAGTASVINASVPMITGFIAHLFFKDFLSRQQIFGLIIGVLGVFLLMYDGITASTKTSPWAFCLAISACCCYAIGGNLSKKFLSEVSPMTTASSGLLVSGAVTLPIVAFFFPSHSISFFAWASVITIAVLSTAIAMILFYHLIQNIGPTRTTVVTLIVPLFAILFGVIFLGEKITIMMLFGAIIVLCGTSLTIFSKH